MPNSMKNIEQVDARFCRIDMKKELPLYPFCSEESVRHEPRKTGWMRHPFLLICGIREGSLHYVFREKKIVLRAREVMLIPPRTSYYFESCTTGGAYEKLVLEIGGTILPELLNSLNLTRIEVWKNELWRDFTEAFRFLHAANQKSASEDLPDIAAALIRFLHQCSMKSLRRNRTGTDPVLSAACRWIEENLDKPVDLELLRKKLNLSRASLGRLFRNGCGMSPRHYWDLRRNETAEFLLLHSDQSMKEIAFHLGYSSQFHFSRDFSGRHFMPPSQFRRRGLV